MTEAVVAWAKPEVHIRLTEEERFRVADKETQVLATDLRFTLYEVDEMDVEEVGAAIGADVEVYGDLVRKDGTVGRSQRTVSVLETAIPPELWAAAQSAARESLTEFLAKMA